MEAHLQPLKQRDAASASLHLLAVSAIVVVVAAAYLGSAVVETIAFATVLRNSEDVGGRAALVAGPDTHCYLKNCERTAVQFGFYRLVMQQVSRVEALFRPTSQSAQIPVDCHCCSCYAWNAGEGTTW